ncbi:hypothetical protein KJ836_02375 [Patescibacteria group bacterium]|nr:hypothetical protein [Patescibacteria group bacterium]
MVISVEKVREFFFAGMIKGYASGAEAEPIPKLPGFKGYRHSDEDGLTLLDYYAPSSTGFSAGSTIIWLDGIPIWLMTYEGWYENCVTSLLKEALMEAYTKGVFLGGRGINRVAVDDGAEYINIDPGSNFCFFSGIEQIVHGGNVLGTHSFRGGCLVDMR